MIFNQSFYDHFRADTANSLTEAQFQAIYAGNKPIYIDYWQDPTPAIAETAADAEKNLIAHFRRSAEFQILEQQFTIIMLGLHEWCKRHELENCDLWLHLHNTMVTTHMTGIDIRTAISFYGAGKRALEAIYYICIVQNVAANIEHNKELMQNFIIDGRLEHCVAGAYIGIINLSLRISNTEWHALLRTFRSDYVHQLALEFTFKNVFKHGSKDPAGELHYVTFLENQVHRFFDLPYKSDVHLSFSFLEHKCEQFASLVHNGIGISILEQISAYLVASAQSAKTYADCDNFIAKFNELGNDTAFYFHDVFELDCTGTNVSCNPTALFAIRCSLIQRFINNKYFDPINYRCWAKLKDKTTSYTVISTSLAWSWILQKDKVHNRFERRRFFDPNNDIDFAVLELDEIKLLKHSLETRQLDVAAALVKYPRIRNMRFKLDEQLHRATMLHIAFYFRDITLLRTLLNARFQLSSDWSRSDTKQLIRLAGEWKDPEVLVLVVDAFREGQLQFPTLHANEVAIISNVVAQMQQKAVIETSQLFAILGCRTLELDHDQSNEYLTTLMISCTKLKLFAAVSLLLAASADENSHYGSRHWQDITHTCLYIAADQLDLKTTKVLLKNNADPWYGCWHGYIVPPKNYLQSAMHVALSKGNRELAELMIQHCDRAVCSEMLVEACAYYKGIAWIVLDIAANLDLHFIGTCHTCSINIYGILGQILKQLQHMIKHKSPALNIATNSHLYKSSLEAQALQILHCNANNLSPLVAVRLQLARLCVQCIVACAPEFATEALCNVALYDADLALIADKEREWDTCYATDIGRSVVANLNGGIRFSLWQGGFSFSTAAASKMATLIHDALLKYWNRFAGCDHKALAQELAPVIFAAVCDKLGSSFFMKYWEVAELQTIETELVAAILKCIQNITPRKPPPITTLSVVAELTEQQYTQLTTGRPLLR